MKPGRHLARAVEHATACAAGRPDVRAVVILVEPGSVTVVGDVPALPPGLRAACEAATTAPDETLCTCAVHGTPPR